MQIANNTYISEDLCTAPEYHLAINTSKELPTIEPELLKSQYLDSLAEISAIQIFEDIPGIRKNRITIDANNLFEIWEPIPNRILLIEDLDFLRTDNQRIEAIVEKLIWLGNSWLNAEILTQKTPIANWQDVLKVISEYDYKLDLITIKFQPYRIVSETYNKSNQPTEYWGVYPNCWDISLNQTRTFNGGFIIDDYNTPYKFRIKVWAGMPFFRNAQTGEVVTMESLY